MNRHQLLLVAEGFDTVEVTATQVIEVGTSVGCAGVLMAVDVFLDGHDGPDEGVSR